MKYIRKIVCFVAAVAFLVSVIIGLAVIFAVKNVNVTFISYAEAENLNEGQEKVRGEIEKIRGTSMMLVDENDALEGVDGGEYKLVSFEKVYPCTVNVTLEQRVAVFSATVDGKMSTYDIDGRFLKQENKDGTVEILGAVSGQDIPVIAAVCKSFKSHFNGLLSTVESVKVEPDVEFETLVFNLRGGFKIDIVKYRQKTEAKCERAAKEFFALSDVKKLAGRLHCFERADGTVVAEYIV